MYQHEAQFMVKERGALRLPSVRERELLMGFNEGYVGNALPPKLSLQQTFDLGASMLGTSFQVTAVVVLLHTPCFLNMETFRKETY